MDIISRLGYLDSGLQITEEVLELLTRLWNRSEVHSKFYVIGKPFGTS